MFVMNLKFPRLSAFPSTSLFLTHILIMGIFIRIATLNTGGIRSSAEKQLAITDFIKDQKIDICFLQETNFEINEEEFFKYQWKEGNIVFNSKSTHSREVGGLALVCTPSYHYSGFYAEAAESLRRSRNKLRQSKYFHINVRGASPP